MSTVSLVFLAVKKKRRLLCRLFMNVAGVVSASACARARPFVSDFAFGVPRPPPEYIETLGGSTPSIGIASGLRF